jgi:ArsR family transcriptional regulator
METSEAKERMTTDLAKIFKALSDENRLAIFQLIREGCSPDRPLTEAQVGGYVSEIAQHFDLALSTVSHHLKELRNARLIHCKKQGQWVYCTPNQGVIQEIEAFLQRVE